MLKDILPLEDWLPNPKRPVLVAGPCSAESEQQVMEIARRLKPLNPSLYRAGIWKPRTRPGAFEGIGAVGLKWLQQVKQEYGIKTTVEVANTHHVELCLEHGIDVLWIGARSTVNPFTVQEIADSLQGVDIPVMVKNPVNPDLNLWIGAIERFYNAGINKLVAVHRGFSHYEKSRYRNKPMWEIPIELKRIMPNLPILCDPSHISGKRALLQEVSQKAYDLSFDGLMVECHIDPDKALSDNEQQIVPEDLATMLQSLIIRSKNTDDHLFNTSLEQLRAVIDKLDEELVRNLHDRMVEVEKIAQLKKEKNITILQPDRWNEIFLSRTEWAEENGLSKDFILRVFQLIHQESIREQTQIMNNKEAL